ncbi:glycosyltransferase family 61 protein [Methylorubrum sp. SL192]|uniref:glycosyltransferase family 61 protein n=1 Tax=Methylorubrum sp. SL192 TaxID=2995167 RepID=UPI00227276A7|nr:glycosyltransferase family 61 protein [Methylorubrum sp. SL192]MCY1643268.1 glycosyltransferase family 61 protein [Methylorubrum sp. SL192]
MTTYDIITHECVYLGPLYHHYGHYLVTSLARCWYLLKNKRHKVVFHTYVDVEQLHEKPFIRQTFEALGIQISDVVIPQRPTLFRKIIVPAPSFQELSFAHDIHATLCRKIGSQLSKESRFRSNEPIFLSKEKLESGVWRFTNENILCSYLHKRGVRIIHPEQLSFIEQIDLFNQHQNIIGIAGSGLHTSLFAANPNNLLGINFESHIPSNFKLIDGICHNHSKYVYPKLSSRVTDKLPFQRSHSLDDVTGVAESLNLEIQQLEYLPTPSKNPRVKRAGYWARLRSRLMARR